MGIGKWTKAQLKEVTAPTGTRNPVSSTKESFLYIDIQSIDNSTQNISSPKNLLCRDAPSRARIAIKENDILFSLVRPYLKNIVIVPDWLDDEIASTAFCSLRPECDIESKFIFYYLIQDTTINSIPTYGNSPPAARDDEFFDIALPLAPAQEQRRIVAKIEELFSNLDAGIAALERAKAKLAQHYQSVLKWAFEGKLTEEWRKANHIPSDWCIVDITHLILPHKNALKAGPFGSALKKSMYVSHGYKIYGQEQVISGIENYGNYFISEKKYNELISCKIAPNDILISLVGTVGKVLILSDKCKPGIINPRLIKISIDENKMLAKFFKYYFESSYLKSLYKEKTNGTTMDVLNMGMIKSLPFPWCRLEEQRQIICEIESRFSICSKLEQLINDNITKARDLRQAILKHAFEGKLVPQDPDDESASVLLERIRQERTSKLSRVSSARKGRKKKNQESVHADT